MIRDSLEKLSRQFDIIVIEGAGSPAEINLRRYDIANMTARYQLGWRPHLFCLSATSIWAECLPRWWAPWNFWPKKSALSREEVFLINKFRGDISLFKDGIEFLEARTGKKVLGVLPFINGLQVAEEDSIPESKVKPCGAQ